MKKTGIVMSSDHPTKILAGTKTMTRRVINPQPKDDITKHWTGNWCSGIKGDSYEKIHICPYGQVGDRLWVRETWQPMGYSSEGKAAVLYKAGNKRLEVNCSREEWERACYYRGFAQFQWRPSIFMPKWASRIWLEITGVRMERLQEITYPDVVAEGITDTFYDYAGKFVRLWDSLNAKRGYGWEANPWVWVVSFKVLNDN